MDRDPNMTVTVFAGVVVAATMVWAIVMQFRTRPRRPKPGPATMDLGTEPPAVVDLITDDFRVTQEAVPATLVDLAARRWLSIEEVGGGDVIIRVSDRDRDEPLAPYERRLLTHVQQLAVDHVVPTAAMTTGPEAVSKRWWRGFRREVIDDAHARGLCRDRWTTAMLAPIWAGTVGAGTLLWLAEKLGEQHERPVGPGPEGWLWGVILVAVAGLGVWSFTLRQRDLQRDTDTGLAVAGSWLGVRHHMATIGDFEDKPAAMVTLWDRYLAHAVALDLAPLVVAQLPLGNEDHRQAWSRATGAWRQVRIRYPWLRPGYGQHPLFALFTSVGTLAVATVVIVFAVRVQGDEIDLVTDLPENVGRGVEFSALVVGVIAVIVLAWNAVKFLFALADVARTDLCEGLVIRARVRRGWVGLTDQPSHDSDDTTKERFFVALDTGERTDFAAWRIRRSLFTQIRQGDRHLIRVTPLLRYVRSVAPNSSAPGTKR